MNESDPFIGPGKLFATEEEAFAEYIEFMEWATQTSPEEVARFKEALDKEIERRKNTNG